MAVKDNLRKGGKLTLYSVNKKSGNFTDSTPATHTDSCQLALDPGEYIIDINCVMGIENGGSPGSNYKILWNEVTFPTNAIATLLHESEKPGIYIQRIYQVKAPLAGNINVVANINGYYDKDYEIKICALSQQ